MLIAFNRIEQLGLHLAHARADGVVADLPLSEISDLGQAEAVQACAAEEYGGSQVGYSVQGTSVLTMRLLNCQMPIFGPLFEDDIRQDAARIRLPGGVLGVGCSLAFILGRPYPVDGEVIARSTASEAVVSCRPFLQLIGRRAPGSAPLNAQTSTADFALDVASIVGPPALNFEYLDLSAVQVQAKINGNVVATGLGADILGHPLEAVAWLARALGARGRRLEAGDLVATGSCAGILQVAPGQAVEAEFNGVGTVEATFD